MSKATQPLTRCRKSHCRHVTCAIAKGLTIRNTVVAAIVTGVLLHLAGCASIDLQGSKTTNAPIGMDGESHRGLPDSAHNFRR